MKIESITAQFFDFQQFISAEPFGAGHINDTWRVEFLEKNERRSVLLQRLNHHVFREPEAVAHNILLVAEWQAWQPYPLKILQPMPVTKLGGNLKLPPNLPESDPKLGGNFKLPPNLSEPEPGFLFKNEQGDYWRAFPFFEQTRSIERVETPEQAYAAAKAFGAFSKSLDGIEVGRLRATIPGFHDGMKRLAYFKQVLTGAIPERLVEAKSEVEEILHNQLIFNKIASLDLPLRAVHHDTKINNVLFENNSLTPVAVVDLDTVMPGIVLSDFGDLMRTSASPADEDEADLSKIEARPAVLEALHEGFLSEMSERLTPLERQNLFEGGRWLTLMQAVRFLGDYLEGDTYYKVKYPGHNLVRARNQLALFRSLTNSF